MADNLIEFHWEVPARGYHWEAGVAADTPRGRAQPALVELGSGPGGPAEALIVRPEPDAALFRLFAALGPENKNGILAFANRYGNLGVETEIRVMGADGAESCVTGTVLADWQHQINNIARLVGLWELIQRKDQEQLARHIQWHEEHGRGFSVRFSSHAGGGRASALGQVRVVADIASAKHNPQWLEKWQAGELFRPAWRYLQCEIDQQLRQVASDIAVGVGWDEQRERSVLRLVCPTLLSAAWTQFADAVSNDRAFSQCRECAKWFEISPEVARAHKQFCSNRCRVKAYRGRQDKARQMFMQKKGFDEIAEMLDSDVSTVKRWITGSRD